MLRTNNGVYEHHNLANVRASDRGSRENVGELHGWFCRNERNAVAWSSSELEVSWILREPKASPTFVRRTSKSLPEIISHAFSSLITLLQLQRTFTLLINSTIGIFATLNFSSDRRKNKRKFRLVRARFRCSFSILVRFICTPVLDTITIAT